MGVAARMIRTGRASGRARRPLYAFGSLSGTTCAGSPSRIRSRAAATRSAAWGALVEHLGGATVEALYALEPGVSEGEPRDRVVDPEVHREAAPGAPQIVNRELLAQREAFAVL